MSMANECDLCGALYKGARGNVSLEAVYVMQRDCRTLSTWSNVDFCPVCSRKLLALIGKALNGLGKK